MKILTVDFKNRALVNTSEMAAPVTATRNPILMQIENRFKKSRSHLHLVDENHSQSDAKQELNVAESISHQIDALDMLLQNKDYFLMNRYVNNAEATDKAVELLIYLSRSMESLNEISEIIQTQLIFEAGIKIEIPLLGSL